MLIPMDLQAGTPRTTVEKRLEALPGKQLVIVSYSPIHQPLDLEWVYNAADIDGSKVVWARAMSPQEDLELIRYFKNRQVWLVEPEAPGNKLRPYPIPTGIPPVENAAAYVREGPL
jgi:hypothetical protein